MTLLFHWIRTLRRRPISAWPVAASMLLALALAGCGGATLPGMYSGGQAAPPPLPQTAPPPLVETPPPPPSETPTQALPLAPGEKAKLGLLLPLSGPNASLGQAMLDAAQMALFDIPDGRVTLMPRDTHGTAEGAAAAARDAIDQGARLLIGPLTAAEVEAVKPVAGERGIAVLAFSTAAALAGNGTYLLGFLPAEEVRRVVGFAHEKGAQRFAILAPGTAYGQVVADAFKTVAQNEQVSVAQTVFYDPSATDLSPSVRELAKYDSRKAALDQQRRQLATARDPASQEALKRLMESQLAGDAGFDAVLLPAGGQQLKTLAPLLPYYGIDPTRIHYLGTGLWDDPALLTEPELEGAWYAAPDPSGRTDFDKRFQALYSHAPPRLASLAYDATALAAALTRGEKGGDFSADALTTPSGFLGIDGIFRLRPDGRVERGLAVMEIHRNGATVVSPEPQSFTGY